MHAGGLLQVGAGPDERAFACIARRKNSEWKEERKLLTERTMVSSMNGLQTELPCEVLLMGEPQITF